MTAVATRRTNKCVAKFACKFGNVGIGDETANLGLAVSREQLNIDAADDMFCGKRLKVRVVVSEGDPDQKQFWDDLRWDIEATADVKSFRVTAKRIATSLVFQLSEISAEQLSHFARREGHVFVLKVHEAAADEGDEDKEGDEGDTE